MEKKHIGFDLAVFDSLDEMTAADQGLLEKAEEARKNSYSPYSKFKVGAALLLENNTILLGSNQENASYPAGLCAEGVAVFNAGANHPQEKIIAIAIVAYAEDQDLEQPAAPCGICRQAIAEYEKKQKAPIRILMKASKGPIFHCESIADLLPLGFDSSFL